MVLGLVLVVWNWMSGHEVSVILNADRVRLRYIYAEDYEHTSSV